MTLNKESPGQLCHGQKTSLTNDSFPEAVIVQIKLWESGNKMKNLREHTLPAEIRAQLCFVSKRKTGIVEERKCF